MREINRGRRQLCRGTSLLRLDPDEAGVEGDALKARHAPVVLPPHELRHDQLQRSPASFYQCLQSLDRLASKAREKAELVIVTLADLRERSVRWELGPPVSLRHRL